MNFRITKNNDIKIRYFSYCGQKLQVRLGANVGARHTGTPKEYNACRVDELPEAPRGGYKDIVELNKEIKRIISE